MAIEIFDTDFIITNGKRKVKKKVTENGVEREVETNEFYAEGVGNVKIGFRMYDPKTRSIVDQQLFNKSNTWSTTGSSIQDAIVRLVAKDEATRYVKAASPEVIMPVKLRLCRYRLPASFMANQVKHRSWLTEVAVQM